MLLKYLSVLIVTIILNSTTSSPVTMNKSEKIVVCYLGSWAVYRPERGSFAIENIEPGLCTHIIYSFAGLNATSDSIRSLDPWQDLADNYGKDGYGRIVKIRQTHPKIKISLAIGGWNEGSANYSAMAADPLRRANFVNSALQFIKKYNFDGLDLDWEFPGKRGGHPYDKENFVLLVKELSSAMKKHNLLLTAALSAGPETIDVAYDIPNLSQYLDYIHLMCYDYHGTWDLKTGSNAPLRSNDDLSVEYSVKYLLKLGAPRHKLVMGVPFYGRTFILTNSSEQTIQKFGIPALNKGFQGPYTREDGFMGYNEICIELQTNSGEWEIHWDNLSQTPFAVNGNKFIAYDNPQSITEKVRLAQKYKLGGIMIWSIDTDDFHGDCSNSGSLTNARGFPLLRTVNIVLASPLPEPEDIDNNEIPIDNETQNTNNGSTCSSNILLLLLPILFKIMFRS